MSVKEMCLAIYSDYMESVMQKFAPNSAAVLKPVIGFIKENSAASLAAYLEEKILQKTAGAAKQDIATLRALWSGDFKEAFKGGLISDLIIDQTHNFFALLYSRVKLAFILLLLPVALEITAYAFMRRRKAAVQ